MNGLKRDVLKLLKVIYLFTDDITAEGNAESGSLKLNEYNQDSDNSLNNGQITLGLEVILYLLCQHFSNFTNYDRSNICVTHSHPKYS